VGSQKQGDRLEQSSGRPVWKGERHDSRGGSHGDWKNVTGEALAETSRAGLKELFA
jgi:hypothetical protein